MPTDPTPQIMADLKLASQRLTTGQAQEAVRICRQVLARFPENPQAHYALGVCFAQLRQPDEAIAAYRSALKFKPDLFEACVNLGPILASRGKFDEAIAVLREAAGLRPDVAEIQVNLSNVCRDGWKTDEAISAARRALELKPSLAEAHLCLGAALANQGHFDQAIASYRQAIQIRPDFPAAHLNLGLALLVTGDLEAGWPEYDWRQRAGLLPQKNFSQPRWTGQPLVGKTILLHAEQGFGDAIHFIRYVPQIAARGAKIIVECPQPLVRLFQALPGIERVVTTGQSLPNFDFHIPLPSLPGVFHTTLNSIPAPIPYVFADAAATEIWRERINPSAGIRQIGFVWAGSRENLKDRNRSIPLEQFAPIFATEKARFHSLQIAPPPASSFPLSDWSKYLTDFAETAALIANLDLIISVDTAAAHLAAAMGNIVWLLIPFPPDWRWLPDRKDSPWYPTIRLFRRSEAGDWKKPIEDVAESLEQFEKS
jgi:Flp pilus assembly protein TadD